MKGVRKGGREKGGRKKSVEGCNGERVRNRLHEGKEKKESVEKEDKNKRRNIHNVTYISREMFFFFQFNVKKLLNWGRTEVKWIWGYKFKGNCHIYSGYFTRDRFWFNIYSINED